MRKILITIISVLIILLIILICLFITPKREDKYDSKRGQYINTSNDLKKEHCMDSVCVRDVVIYYNKDIGTIEYMLTNKSSDKKSGYLKMIFNNKSVIIYYSFNGRESYSSSTNYDLRDLGKVNNYKLGKVTQSEIEKIIGN